MAELELSPAVFSILSALIEERVGLHYGLLDRDILQEKASTRAMEAGFDSLLDYYYFLRYDERGATEFKELTESLVVNETYFFREWPAIRALVDSFIVPWCREGHKLRVWSAACATGEEPLSLAMLLADRNLLAQVEIVATDVSTRVLSKARSGIFSKRSVRQVPAPHLQERFIAPMEGGYTVAPELVQAIEWKPVNLLNASEIEALGTFDVILCRNVLIYFSDTTVRQVLDQLARRLLPHGVLLVGVSESLLRYGSTFSGQEHEGAFFYRKANLR